MRAYLAQSRPTQFSPLSLAPLHYKNCCWPEIQFHLDVWIMSLSSSQCSIDSKTLPEGSRAFVFVTRENSTIGLGLLNIPETGKGEPSVVWKNMELPPTLRKEMIAKMELVKKLPSDPQAQLEHLQKLGGEMGYHELCYGVVYTSNAVIWASSSGIVALSRATGALVANWDSFVGANRLWMDEARCIINTPEQTFELATKRGGAFFADCHRANEQLLVYFNGVEFILLSSPFATGIPIQLNRIPYDPSSHKIGSTNPSIIKAKVTTTDKIEISLDGMVYL